MNFKTPNYENFKISKLPLVPTHSLYNPRNNFNSKKRRNNSKKIKEKNNIGKLSGSYQSKTNYKFKLAAICPTIEVNKNTSGNNSYQNQILVNPNITNEKNFEYKEETIEKLTVNKTNLRGIKTKLDKNKSFVIRNDKRELSFNKRDITPSLLKHISIRSKNKIISNNTNNYFKHLESNSAFSLLDSNNNINKGFGIKPTYLQYDFEKLKINHSNNINNINQKFSADLNNISQKFNNNINNINLNINNNNIDENNKFNSIEDNCIIDNNNHNINVKNNKINIENNIKKIGCKNKGCNNNNNNNNLYIKINNNLTNMNNNNNRHKHHLYINSQKMANNEEYFYENEEKELELTKEEKAIYGNRTMKHYIKKKLLGKGGCGIVWLCNKNITNSNNSKMDFNEYAVKQISKKASNTPSLINLNINEDNFKIARNEIKILRQLNENNIIKKNDTIPKIYDFYEDSNDIWFSFEKGGKSLSSLSYKIKGEFEKGERIYHIQKGIFLKLLFTNIKQFKLFIKKILLGIQFINGNGIIHSDIKPDNILIEYNNNNDNLEIKSIKIIDYGSAFYYENTSAISSNTPEYLCPEITHGNKKFLKDLSNKNSDKKYISCIDIWSFGITLLELCLCCPIWMSYKSKIVINSKTFYCLGYFGCRGRDSNKIYQKQVELSKNLEKILKISLLYLFNQNDKDNFINLLSRMLEFDYRKRITVEEAINHEFLKDEVQSENKDVVNDNKININDDYDDN